MTKYLDLLTHITNKLYVADYLHSKNSVKERADELLMEFGFELVALSVFVLG